MSFFFTFMLIIPQQQAMYNWKTDKLSMIPALHENIPFLYSILQPPVGILRLFIFVLEKVFPCIQFHIRHGLFDRHNKVVELQIKRNN